MKQLVLLTFTFLLFAISAIAQDSGFLEGGSNRSNGVLISPTVGIQFPQADLQTRFGNSLGAGAVVELIRTKQNWLLGVNGQYMVGSTVKEDVLAELRNDRNQILNDFGGVTQLFLRQRMAYIGGHIGRIFPLSRNNSRAGIRIDIGAGYFFHKIRIQNDDNNDMYFTDEYKKGFDRFTSGIATRQFLGYQLLARNRLSNFFIGVEAMQGFTKNTRSFDFAERRELSGSRLDATIGLRAGWTLVIYSGSREAGDIYY